jgi:hypothetical protein
MNLFLSLKLGIAQLSLYILSISNPRVVSEDLDHARLISEYVVNRITDTILFDGMLNEPAWNPTCFPPLSCTGQIRENYFFKKIINMKCEFK